MRREGGNNKKSQTHALESDDKNFNCRYRCRVGPRLSRTHLLEAVAALVHRGDLGVGGVELGLQRLHAFVLFKRFDATFDIAAAARRSAVGRGGARIGQKPAKMLACACASTRGCARWLDGDALWCKQTWLAPAWALATLVVRMCSARATRKSMDGLTRRAALRPLCASRLQRDAADGSVRGQTTDVAARKRTPRPTGRWRHSIMFTFAARKSSTQQRAPVTTLAATADGLLRSCWVILVGKRAESVPYLATERHKASTRAQRER